MIRECAGLGGLIGTASSWPMATCTTYTVPTTGDQARNRVAARRKTDQCRADGVVVFSHKQTPLLCGLLRCVVTRCNYWKLRMQM